MQAPKADVIVTVDSDLATILGCLQSVLQHSGPALRRLIVIDDHGPQSEMAEALDRLAEGDGRVHRVGNSSYPLGFAGSCNRGLSAREGDAVLLGGDCIVGGDWLTELAAVAHSEERTACAVAADQRARNLFRDGAEVAFRRPCRPTNRWSARLAPAYPDGRSRRCCPVPASISAVM